MTQFISGLELCRRFYHEAVEPVLADSFPGLRHSAGLLGEGSEVLGYDTPMSTDHHWGPRLMLFLREEDHGLYAADIVEQLRWRLPARFLGYPTNFSPPDPDNRGTQMLRPIEGGPINHRVNVLTWRGFVWDQLRFTSTAEAEPADWLTFPQQRLLGLTEGALYHDGLDLAAGRRRFAWYPRDVWLYLLAAGWARIGQEEHLMGRAGFAGDEAGSALIGASLVRAIMQLCFLMERRYAPYAKWFGTAFARLAAAPVLQPVLLAVLHAGTWQERGQALASAYDRLAAMHNALGITESLPAEATPFFGRPFQVIWGQRFSDAILSTIEDPAVRSIAARRPIGSIDQWTNNTDLLADPDRRPALLALYKVDV